MAAVLGTDGSLDAIERMRVAVKNTDSFLESTEAGHLKHGQVLVGARGNQLTRHFHGRGEAVLASHDHGDHILSRDKLLETHDLNKFLGAASSLFDFLTAVGKLFWPATTMGITS
jgi:hypothetical protein